MMEHIIPESIAAIFMSWVEAYRYMYTYTRKFTGYPVIIHI